ncbi:hypothetical protein EVAR_96148_1 [Eumeta japonica]|uniref:Uncharacterized protein n=1 Tax=Eumeta variegata TaxID=151549 RepID=A0A4C1VHY0_EUMVA|nr:hypothetical protein EVAR_96148_1 [Eumeta japonica]
MPNVGCDTSLVYPEYRRRETVSPEVLPFLSAFLINIVNSALTYIPSTDLVDIESCRAINCTAGVGVRRCRVAAAHPQKIADSHIHQGVRSIKTTDTSSLCGPLSCNGQRAKKTFLRQPQTTTW